MIVSNQPGRYHQSLCTLKPGESLTYCISLGVNKENPFGLDGMAKGKEGAILG